jgi:ABC-type lipoprotein release transport system permease subunit
MSLRRFMHRTKTIAFIVTPVLLSAVAPFAAWIPAKRATSIDPMTALRLE